MKEKTFRSQTFGPVSSEMAEPKEEKEIKYGKGAYLTEMDHHPGEDAMLKGFQIGGQTFIAGKYFSDKERWY